MLLFCRAALEAKAVLYEKLVRGENLPSSDDEEEDGPRYMVDFHRKTYEEVWFYELVFYVMVE